MPAFAISQKLDLPWAPKAVVIIGAGGIVKDAHLPAYRKAGFPVAGIYDLDVSRARNLAETFSGGKVFGSLDEAARQDKNTVFDVAVPASAILDVLPSLPEGSGVLIQKPMGNNLVEARAIRDLCREKKFVAAINFQLRYAPAILAARSLIDQGAIGQVHSLEIRLTVYTPWHLWTFMEGIPRVEILYHSIHYLDMIRSFLGEPKGVYAKTVKHPKFPRLASTRTSIFLDYGDAVLAAITTNHGHEFGLRHQESYVKWEGTRGAIKTRLGLLLNYPKGEPDEFEYCVLEEGKPPQWQAMALEGSWFPDAFIGTMSSLMRVVEGSTDQLPTSVDDAFRTMALVEAAYESSDSGGVPISL